MCVFVSTWTPIGTNPCDDIVCAERSIRHMRCHAKQPYIGGWVAVLLWSGLFLQEKFSSASVRGKLDSALKGDGELNAASSTVLGRAYERSEAAFVRRIALHQSGYVQYGEAAGEWQQTESFLELRTVGAVIHRTGLSLSESAQQTNNVRLRTGTKLPASCSAAIYGLQPPRLLVPGWTRLSGATICVAFH